MPPTLRQHLLLRPPAQWPQLIELFIEPLDALAGSRPAELSQVLFALLELIDSSAWRPDSSSAVDCFDLHHRPLREIDEVDVVVSWPHQITIARPLAARFKAYVDEGKVSALQCLQQLGIVGDFLDQSKICTEPYR